MQRTKLEVMGRKVRKLLLPLLIYSITITLLLLHNLSSPKSSAEEMLEALKDSKAIIVRANASSKGKVVFTLYVNSKCPVCNVKLDINNTLSSFNATGVLTFREVDLACESGFSEWIQTLRSLGFNRDYDLMYPALIACDGEDALCIFKCQNVSEKSIISVIKYFMIKFNQGQL